MSDDLPEQARIIDDAIVERPRQISDHPLLALIYARHDRLISQYTSGQTLELAYGTHLHPAADVGIDAFPSNIQRVPDTETAVADARRLPFQDASIDTIIGRRFLHHVPERDRVEMLIEARRVLKPDGRIVILEGTPGYYRQLTKWVGFRTGILGKDTDAYDHLSKQEIHRAFRDAGFTVQHSEALGSPFIPASVFRGEWTRQLIWFHEHAQVVRWWTLAVGLPQEQPSNGKL